MLAVGQVIGEIGESLLEQENKKSVWTLTGSELSVWLRLTLHLRTRQAVQALLTTFLLDLLDAGRSRSDIRLALSRSLAGAIGWYGFISCIKREKL